MQGLVFQCFHFCTFEAVSGINKREKERERERERGTEREREREKEQERTRTKKKKPSKDRMTKKQNRKTEREHASIVMNADTRHELSQSLPSS